MSNTIDNYKLRRNEKIRIAIGMLLMAVGCVLLPFVFGAVIGLFVANWLAKAILRRCVADGERFLSSWRGVLASSALTACFAVAPVVVLVLEMRSGVQMPMHPARGESGDCATYESVAAFLEQPHEPPFEGVISQLPKNARDVHYHFHPFTGVLEFRFPLKEDEFITWAESLAWTREAILANRCRGQANIYSSESDEVPQSVVIANGYQLDSHGFGANHHQCRRIFYDQESRFVYLRLWIPFPTEVINSSIANPLAD